MRMMQVTYNIPVQSFYAGDALTAYQLFFALYITMQDKKLHDYTDNITLEEKVFFAYNYK